MAFCSGGRRSIQLSYGRTRNLIQVAKVWDMNRAASNLKSSGVPRLAVGDGRFYPRASNCLA